MTAQVIDEKVLIQAPVSAVWDALTNPDITEKYWGGGTRVESDWKKGSLIVYLRDGTVVDKHTLHEIVPHRLIEHSFRPLSGELKHEAPSLVTITLTEEGGATRVSVLHRNFPPLSQVYVACRSAWPEILRSMKELLEIH